MITHESAWAGAPLWLLAIAGLAGVAAGICVRHLVAKFTPAVPSASGPADKPTKTRPGLFELLTAAVFALLTSRFGLSAQLPAYLYFAAIAIALATIDLRQRRLPNTIILSGLAITAALLIIASATGTGWAPLLRALLGGALLFTLYLVLAIINPRGLGMGDVKLSALIGIILAFQGWRILFTGTFLGFLIGAVLSIVVLATRRGGLKSSVPFGPSMLAGALAASFL